MGKELALEEHEELADLAARVESGERVVLTRGGKVVATVVPTPPTRRTADARLTLDRLKAMRKGITLPPGMTVKDLINEGRKY
jgi:antitoxin (DNA-binding transcriptional repressor) of toxin-antitoxin stability system